MAMKVSIYLENLQLTEAQAILDMAKGLRSGVDPSIIEPRPAPEAPAAVATPEPKAEPAPASTTDRRAPTPAVQDEIDALLGEGYDWTKIDGTGKDGKITKTDVRKHAKGGASAAAVEPAAPATPEPAAAPAAAPADGVTIDAARAVLKQISDEKGMDVAIELLQKYGVSKVSDLEGDKLAAFIAEGS